MSKFIQYTVFALGVVLLAATLFYLIRNWNTQIGISYKFIGFPLIIFLIGFISKFLANVINVKNIVKRKIVLLLLITVGWIFSIVYIGIFNPWYNRMGRIK